MPDVYTFIYAGLSIFFDNGNYDRNLSDSCFKLNDLLNRVTIDDYNEHLSENINEIHKEIDRINISINEELFVDLSKMVELLHNFQRGNQIIQRDHYYHSIQCFLLAIVLLDEFWPPFKQKPEDIVAILKSQTMYHDIGYV
jgi:hypothetical protein